MKILSFMNVSNRQSLSTDSGYIFYNLLAEHMIAAGHEFTFVSPEALGCSDAKHVIVEMGANKYEARFGFPWEKIKRVLEHECPDVIIANQIELVPNFRALIESSGFNTKLAGYAHYIPYGVSETGELEVDTSLNAPSVWDAVKLSFLAGLQASDVVFTHSQTGYNMLRDACALNAVRFNPEAFEIIPPPRDPSLVNNPVAPNNRKIIYNHRLYDHYGTRFFVDLSHRLAVDLAADVHILDILSARTPERIRMDTSVESLRADFAKVCGVTVRKDGANRQHYKSILENARVAFAPRRLACTWSMACIDSMGMGVPVVSPDVGWFSEYIPDDLKFDSPDQACEITSRLLDDDAYWLDKSHEAQLKTLELAPDKIAQRFVSRFEKMTNENCPGLKL